MLKLLLSMTISELNFLKGFFSLVVVFCILYILYRNWQKEEDLKKQKQIEKKLQREKAEEERRKQDLVLQRQKDEIRKQEEEKKELAKKLAAETIKRLKAEEEKRKQDLVLQRQKDEKKKQEEEKKEFEKKIAAETRQKQKVQSIADDVRLKTEEERRKQDLEKKDLFKTLINKVQQWESLHYNLKYKYLINYYPTTCDFDATESEWQDRWTIWNFKNAPEKTLPYKHQESLNKVIQMLSQLLFTQFGINLLKNLTFVCIPI